MTATRRDVLRLAGVGVIAGPVLLARALVERTPQPLPPAAAGDVLTADSWNALVNRVNDLSRQR